MELLALESPRDSKDQSLPSSLELLRSVDATGGQLSTENPTVVMCPAVSFLLTEAVRVMMPIVS